MAYNSLYMESLSYVTPSTLLSYKECDELHKSVFNAILPKMGINRNVSRAVTIATSFFCNT
jgi:hypothetical protein